MKIKELLSLLSDADKEKELVIWDADESRPMPVSLASVQEQAVVIRGFYGDPCPMCDCFEPEPSK